MDKERRYSAFKIIALPYPGCEFFDAIKRTNYDPENITFDWRNKYHDAKISIPQDNISSQLDIAWNMYETWNLIDITKNYLRVMLKYIQENNDGLLVHCISGWDRTPLFISLLRISLWADGVIHQSLDATQMLYFTISYDWYLFGHNLPDRMTKSEEIFFFCFYMLKFLHGSEFCTTAPK